MRSCQITLQVMNGLLFGGAMTALLCYAITRRALFQTVGTSQVVQPLGGRDCQILKITGAHNPERFRWD